MAKLLDATVGVESTPIDPVCEGGRRMPSLFVAHGLPSYALPRYAQENGLKEAEQYVEMLASLPSKFCRPKAVVCMSAHWETQGEGIRVTTAAKPKTIHQFYGFPQPLYDVQYSALGSPELASVVQSLAPEVLSDDEWGFDHGSWTVLVHLFPRADIPVIELSVDNAMPAKFYFDLGRKLRPLRDQGILVMGSGSIVHNLRQLRWGGPAHDWAIAFNAWVKDCVNKKKDETLVNYLAAPGGRQSVPYPDHYFPFIFALGAAHDDDGREMLIDWIDNGANGMTSFGFGL